MSWTPETRYPCPDSPEQGMANLAMAVLTSLVNDLRGSKPSRRKQARASVEAGVQDCWLDLMNLNDQQRGRVQALLWELAH